MADMILINAIDLSELRIAQTLAIIGSVETVYASTTTSVRGHFALRVARRLRPALADGTAVFLTDIHQIRLGTEAMSIVGSASIEGLLGYDVDKSAFA